MACITVIFVTWWWLGHPVDVPAPIGVEKLECVSYAPFRRGQDPLAGDAHIEAQQIEEDLRQLSVVTNCVRTYSVEHGVDQVPAIAKRQGMKVLLGLWLGPKPDKNRFEIETAIALANRYPDVINAVIIGNEVLLRGEMSVEDLGAIIDRVKAAVPVPVTYADVWEFWLRHRQLASRVDFVTIHLLPYWEDFPIPIRAAAAHADSIRRKVAAAFPGKEILIGEVGWPSAGRMREGALPSPLNQARFIQEVMGIAQRENYRVNFIEAFDQPWKRFLEGTVGGHWGLFDADTRKAKFALGAPVSNHPLWPWQAAGGALFAALVFGAALWGTKRGQCVPSFAQWGGVAVIAAISGIFIGWTIENAPSESLGLGGWLRTTAWAAVALISPLACATAIVGSCPFPAFHHVIGHPKERTSDPLSRLLGVLLIGLTVLSVQVALMLVFDPRYVDFPFAPMVGASVPFLVWTLLRRRPAGVIPPAEKLAAAALGFSAIYILFNETIANWQADLLCAGLAMLTITLARSRDARG